MNVLDLGLADLVQNEEFGVPLRAAKAKIDAGSSADAVGLCVGGFETLIRRWNSYCQALFGLKEGPDDLFATIIGTLSAGIYLPELKAFRECTKGAGSRTHLALEKDAPEPGRVVALPHVSGLHYRYVRAAA